MTDAISALTFDLVTPFSAVVPASAQPPSVFDVSRFENALRSSEPTAAEAEPATAAKSEGTSFRSVVESLQSLNGRVDLLSDSSVDYASGQKEFSPGDMLEMTVRCHQFLFQCELTANVANRTSDGIQQLFRQQS